MLCGFTKQYGTLYSDNLHYILYIYIAQYSVSTVLIISSLQLILSLKHKPLPLFFSRSLPCSLSPPLSHYLAYTFHYTHSYIYYSPLYVHLWLSFSDLHCSNRIHYLLTSLSLSLSRYHYLPINDLICISTNEPDYTRYTTSITSGSSPN